MQEQLHQGLFEWYSPVISSSLENVLDVSSYCLGMVHTDDRLALLEVARQLDIEEELGECASVCLMKNPIIIIHVRPNSLSQLSFAAALNYLLEALRSGRYIHCIYEFLDVLS